LETNDSIRLSTKKLFQPYLIMVLHED